MNKLRWLGTFALIASLGSLAAGCGKKAETTQSPASAAEQPAASTPKSPPASAAKLSGAEEIMAAIDRKDYDGAVAALLRIRQAVSNAEQQVQFATLADEVRIKLLEAAPTQPKAAEALTVVRRITGGR
jgi:hypothetical protein